MRWRTPRFTLLLTGLVAVAALAIVLSGGGPRGAPTTGAPLKIGDGGPQRVCVSTEAVASGRAHGVVSASGTGTAPLTVTQTVVGPRGAVTVSHSGTFRASVQASRHLAVTQRAVTRARACARGPSQAAARGLAVRRAYALAFTRARALANSGARRALRALEHRVYPLIALEAQSAALRRAQLLAQAARPTLSRAARRRAARQAGAA